MPICRPRLRPASPVLPVLILLMFLPAAQAAGAVTLAQECRAEWHLSTRGLAIGSAEDRVRSSSDGQRSVWSDFKPNGLLAMFGVDPATREFSFDAQGIADRRSETRAGSKPEANVWRRLAPGSWVRSLNGVDDKHEETAESLVIDSTSFPYLIHLGLLPASNASRAVAVVSKGKIYPAQLKVQAPQKDGEGFTLDFTSADSRGRVQLAPDGHPLQLEFTDEHGTLRGESQRWHCD